MTLLDTRQVEALVWLTSLEGPAHAARAGFDLAPEGTSLRYATCYQRGAEMMKFLAAQGAARKVAAGQWVVTEKGRIAAALAMAREPGLKAAFFED